MTEEGTTKAGSVHWRAALFSFAVCLPGCGDNDDLPPKPARPIAGCEQYELTPCDTKAYPCQVARLQLASCLKQIPMSRPAPPPPARVMTEQEYVDYRNALFDGITEPPTNHFEVAMTWLGLAEPGSFRYRPLTRDDVKDWFGTYRWREDDLLLIDHGKPANDIAANVALVETLIRALRDRNLDIGAWSSYVSITDIDSRWGGDASYFGEARFYADRYQAALEGVDLAEFNQLAPINQGIHDDVEWIRRQASTFMATNERFPDHFGARAAYLAWQRDGDAGVNAIFDSRLLTQQLMASETEQLAAPAVKLHEKPKAPEAWVTDPNLTAIGAWGLYLALNKRLPADEAWQLALAWRGDQVYVFQSVEPNDETALIWQVDLTTREAAAKLEQVLTSGVSGSDVRRRGTFVTLAKATDDSSLDWGFVAD
jgi:hypothetical protein